MDRPCYRKTLMCSNEQYFNEFYRPVYFRVNKFLTNKKVICVAANKHGGQLTDC